MNDLETNKASRPAALIMCNFDQYHELTKTHGQKAAEEIFSHLLRMTNEPVGDVKLDFVARGGGGGGFFIVLNDTSAEAAMNVAEQLRVAMSMREFPLRGETFRPTVSFGITEVAPGEDMDEVFDRGEVALIEAYRYGGNTCWRHGDELIHDAPSMGLH